MRHLWISAAILTASGAAVAEPDPAVDPWRDTLYPVVEPTVVEPAKPVPTEVRLQGAVRGKPSHELLAGVTVVATRTGADTVTAITDEHGWYALPLAPGTYLITFYYLDVTLEVPNLVLAPGTNTFLPTTLEESRQPVGGCVFWYDHSDPGMSSMPRFGLTTTRNFMPVSRDRTHRAWIAPSAPANPNTAVTTLENGVRLHGAPGIPIAFVQEVSTSTLRVPIGLAAGSGGGADVALRGGSNETHGDARLVFGLDRPGPSGGVQVFAGGPLKTDKAWLGAGLVANRRVDDQIDASGMVVVNYAKSSEHQGAVVALAQGAGDDTRDGWAQARWVSKFDNNKLELTGAATVEQLDLPTDAIARSTIGGTEGDVTNRAGGQVGVKWRHKMVGYHQLVFTARGGGGFRGTTRHDDATIAAGDEWQLRPDIELQVGVRAEARRFGDVREQVLAPRVSLGYDFTKEGRSDVFVAYQRVPHFDDGPVGDWLGKPLHHDELAAGVSFLPVVGNNAVMFGIAGRARWILPSPAAPSLAAPSLAATDTEAQLGLESWVRYDRRTTILHASATTLGNVGTLAAQRRIVSRKADDLFAGVAMRLAPDRREGGGSVVWKHAGARDRERTRADLSFDLALEGYGGTEGPGGRMLLGATW